MSAATRHKPKPRAEDGYERADADVRKLTSFALAFVLLIAAVSLISRWILDGFVDSNAARNEAHPMHGLRAPREGPLLQARPGSELAVQQREKNLGLIGYGWVDRENEIISIPIGIAMQLIAERGLPVRDNPTSKTKGASR